MKLGHAAGIVSFIVAVGSLMRIMHINVVLATILAAVLIFVILPLVKYIP